MLRNGSKTCPACGTTYENALENFYRDKHTKDGMHSRCISCETRGKRTSRVKPLKSLKIEYGVKKNRTTVNKKNYSKSTLEPFYNNDKKTIIAPHQHKLFDTPKGSSIPKRRCISCQKMLPRTKEFFYKHANRKDGLSYQCKKCNDLKKQGWRVRNVELEVYTQKKSKALRAGLEFTLDKDKWVQLLKETNTCGDCNGTMICGAKKQNEKTSFDKIDPTKGYIENNTRLLCMKCNSQKNDLSPEEWNAVLEIRVEKGIIKKVDPKLVEYLKTRDTLEPFFMEYECAN